MKSGQLWESGKINKEKRKAKRKNRESLGRRGEPPTTNGTPFPWLTCRTRFIHLCYSPARRSNEMHQLVIARNQPTRHGASHLHSKSVQKKWQHPNRTTACVLCEAGAPNQIWFCFWVCPTQLELRKNQKKALPRPQWWLPAPQCRCPPARAQSETV